LGGRILDRAKDVARSIGDRVRMLLQGEPESALPLRVLVVDDHPDAADTLAAVLELLGCPVRVCYDGHSALAAADEFHPDACLLDIMMPGMDGLQLADLLRRRAGPRPMLLVATTGLGSLEDRAKTAVGGFHFHLVKPIAAGDLLAALNRFRDLLGRKDATAHPPHRRATDR
jgi:CheY-like chemotaxis protein